MTISRDNALLILNTTGKKNFQHGETIETILTASLALSPSGNNESNIKLPKDDKKILNDLFADIIVNRTTSQLAEKRTDFHPFETINAEQIATIIPVLTRTIESEKDKNTHSWWESTIKRHNENIAALQSILSLLKTYQVGLSRAEGNEHKEKLEALAQENKDLQESLQTALEKQEQLKQQSQNLATNLEAIKTEVERLRAAGGGKELKERLEIANRSLVALERAGAIHRAVMGECPLKCVNPSNTG